MSLGIHGEAMDSVLNAKVFQFAVVVWIILMENGNGAAVTRDINVTKAKIKLDHIGSISDRQKGDCGVLVQIKDCHQVVFFAHEKSTLSAFDRDEVKQRQLTHERDFDQLLQAKPGSAGSLGRPTDS